MKKILFAVLFVAVLTSCKTEVKDYVTFSGKITNQNSDSITLKSNGFSRVIPVAENGTFKDTMKVKKGIYQLFDGKEYATLHLENGNNINMTLDTKKFDETLKFSGKGSETSAYFGKLSLVREAIGNSKDLFLLESDAFNTKISSIKQTFAEIGNTPGIDSLVLSNNTKTFNNFLTRVESQYKAKDNFGKGKPSPKFKDYENYNGGKTSLDDLKGKYVYIDVWATWCGPCIQQIPFLQKLEKTYHGKNIEFVSISTDAARRNGNSWEKANNKWKNFVKAKSMTGTQLWAGEDNSFQTSYQINTIPRFILIDPDGNIVNANAPRPSEPSLIKLFDSLNI